MSSSLAKMARRSEPRPEEHALKVFAPARPGPLGKSLFPLPLTPFEHLFLLDDWPSYPVHFFCRLRFSGRLQQQPLQDALAIALARHPLLTAVVNLTNDREPHWLPSPEPPPPVQWIEQELTPAFPPASHLDLCTRPGLHVAAVVGSSQSDLILQFHHAACDAVGALDFATDLLTAQANVLAGTDRYRFKPLDPSRLRGRGALPLSGWNLFRWGMRRLPRLRSLWRFFRRQPAPVIPHRPHLPETAPRPSFPEGCVHHFTREESAALARIAHGSETSLNGLLVRDLFLALAQVRQRNGLPDDAWLRLMLPINMRTPADRRLPAANKVSTVFLDRCLAEGIEPDKLLGEINGLMEDIKHHDLGLAWLLGIRLSQQMPRAWARARRSRRRCLYSALLTNIGPALAASPLPRADRRLLVGDLVLENVEFLPAARPLQCLGFAVSTYAGRMALGMRYHSGVFTPETAREVLDDYVGALRISMRSS